MCAFALIAGAGCQDSTVDADPPAPNFNHASYAIAPAPQPQSSAPRVIVPVAPQPKPRPPLVARASAPQPRKSAIAMVPADWIPPRNVAVRPWQWIVIHHTATTFGNAAMVTRWHIDRGFDEMGYDFLIGNGTNSGDGQIEVGTRWPKQKWGAHTKTPDNRFNDYGIGICLVGNFDEQYPTQAQMRSLDKLTAYLMKTYKITPDRVLGHGDCKSTDCPGKHLSVESVRRGAEAILADAGESFIDPSHVVLTGELMRDAPK